MQNRANFTLPAERQLSELQGTHTSLTHEPSHASHLNHSMSVSEEDSAKRTSAAKVE
jgi:hypothetical protein